MQKSIFLAILICFFTLMPMRLAAAADFNIHLHFYKLNGVTVGELSFGEQVAFRLHMASDTVPVINMQRGMASETVSPDIVNGMFMLRLN
jgi:hypothetical protein